MIKINPSLKVGFWNSVLLVVLAYTSVLQVEASSVVRSGDVVSLSEGELIEGDFYATASKINISGEVEEDLIAIAGNVTTNGSIGADALLIGGQVNTHGAVGDDLRIVGGEVTIAEPVNGDLLVVGGVVHLLSTASVAGDMVLFGGDMTIEGTVGGDVIGTIETLRIDSHVAGKVDVTVGKLTLGDKTVIDNDVIYTSHNKAERAHKATLGGEEIKNDPILPVVETTIYSILIPILILVFSALVWYWVSRHSLRKVVDRALTKSPRPALIGFLVVVFMPLLLGLLIVSMIGTLVGMTAFVGYVLLILLSFICLPALIGQLIMQSFNSPNRHLTPFTILVGIIGVALLMQLPIVGHALLLLLIILTIGAMVDLLIRPKIE